MPEARWLLPAGFEEVLPGQAQVIECLRRDLLDLYRSWGYELVIPPFIDYLDSLLTGTGRDLDQLTFKLTDQRSGRLLGVRADMTPQVARIDAHHLCHDAPTRLCYLDTVLTTHSDGFAGTRSPLQIGAEIYGHQGTESDTEIVRLLLLTLKAAGIERAYLDLGHVGIYRGLARQARLGQRQEHELFDVLQRKALPEMEGLIGQYGVTGAPARMLLALAELSGDDALASARVELRQADAEVHNALDYLDRVAGELTRWLPDVPVHFDLAELRGYHYKTGVVFAAFVPGWGLEVARGGRYDDIGAVFGRPRPAVGFSCDLKGLLRHVQGALSPQVDEAPVLAPYSDNPLLQQLIADLRAAGRRVIIELPGVFCEPRALGCTERLEPRGNAWALVPCE